MVLRVQPLKPTPLWAVSPPVWSLADRKWSLGRLRCLRAIPLEGPLLSTVIASPSLFTWVPLGIFLRLFQDRFWQPLQGLLPVPLSFSTFLSFPPIPCRNRLSEPVATDYLKTDLVHTPVLIAYSRCLELIEWELCLLRSLFPLHFWDQSQKIRKGLPSVYLGIYQELLSLPVLCLPIWHSLKP